jgi:hypothetical protein
VGGTRWLLRLLLVLVLVLVVVCHGMLDTST